MQISLCPCSRLLAASPGCAVIHPHHPSVTEIIGFQQVIAEIAQNSGLSHVGRFSREFADIVDEAPSDARDRAINRCKT